MWIGNNGVHTFTLSFSTKRFSQRIDSTVYTTYRWDNPDFVPHSYFTIRTFITFESNVFFRYIQRNFMWLIFIIKHAIQVCFNRFFVHPISLSNVLTSVSDWITVFDNMRISRQRSQSKFMPGRYVCINSYFYSVNRYFLSFLQVYQSHSNIVGDIYFYIFHFYKVNEFMCIQLHNLLYSQ